MDNNPHFEPFADHRYTKIIFIGLHSQAFNALSFTEHADTATIISISALRDT